MLIIRQHLFFMLRPQYLAAHMLGVRLQFVRAMLRKRLQATGCLQLNCLRGLQFVLTFCCRMLSVRLQSI
jgi:hypothetical protein